MTEREALALVRLAYLTPRADKHAIMRARELLYEHYAMNEIVDMWIVCLRSQTEKARE